MLTLNTTMSGSEQGLGLSNLKIQCLVCNRFSTYMSFVWKKLIDGKRSRVTRYVSQENLENLKT